MGGRVLITDDRTGPFFSNPLAFCVDLFATCFSHDADKLCVLVGLSSLSALFLLLSCLVLVYQRCKSRGENPGEAIVFFYCFLGNLCSTVGAILSRQLYIQILMGAFAAAMDAVNVTSCCLPAFLCWNLKTERELRIMRRRRRQHLFAVCVLMVVAGGFLEPRVTHDPTDRPFNGRRLLHINLQFSRFRFNTEILGYMLGLISLVIACTSRFPAVRRAYRGQILTRAYMFSALLCSMAGALYTTAILLYDTQFMFLLRVMPWLLSAICCVTLDLLILVLHRLKNRTMQHSMRFSPDTASLLGGSDIPTEETAIMKKHRKQIINSSAEPKEGTLSKEETEDRPLNRTMRVIRVDSSCFSDTSCDSLLVSSDLEWDFEEADGQWRESKTKQQEGDEFSLQEWSANPKPFNIGTCAVSGLPQNTLSVSEEGESVSVC